MDKQQVDAADSLSLHRWAQTGSLLETSARPEKQPESWLELIDARYPAEPASEWVWSYLQASAEHLALWAAIVSPDQEAPVRLHYGPSFTLLRGAMESAAQALWVLAADTPEEGLLRHLRLMHKDFSEQKLLQKSADPTELPALTAVERLAAFKQRVEGMAVSWPSVSQRVGYLTVIRDVAPLVELDPQDAEVQWRCASGMAHGRRWAPIATATWTATTDPAPDIGFLAGVAEVTVRLAWEAMRMLIARSAPRGTKP